MKENNKAFESLIAGGLIGAALGAILSKDKEEGSILGALIGAAISATLKANENAQQTNQPVLIVENGKLYQVYSDRKKKFLKNLPTSSTKWPEHLKLK